MKKNIYCEICSDEPKLAKYKCPTCLIHYCSVPCFKKHKENPCKKPEPSIPESVAQPKRKFEEDDEDENSHRLQREDLRKLARSSHIRACLKDSELQQLVKSIDSSQKAEAALDFALLQPKFHEFCDQVLSVLSSTSDQ
mmetsp:Transcript_35954/g.49913  ORF Transcript_35954/g.49913 Transcript_35954/m.49913 type:complete len:139 (-) Transcript_35954:104-520(-)